MTLHNIACFLNNHEKVLDQITGKITITPESKEVINVEKIRIIDTIEIDTLIDKTFSISNIVNHVRDENGVALATLIDKCYIEYQIRSLTTDGIEHRESVLTTQNGITCGLDNLINNGGAKITKLVYYTDNYYSMINPLLQMLHLVKSQ